MKFTALIVNGCCVLHNITIRWRIPLDEMYDEEDVAQPSPILYRNCGNPEGEETRNRVIEWYFTD